MAATFGAGYDPYQASFGAGGPNAANPYNLTNNGMNSQVDQPSAIQQQLADEQAQRDRAAAAQIQGMAGGGNDYWQTALTSQGAGQQYGVPGYQTGSFGPGYTAPTAPQSGYGNAGGMAPMDPSKSINNPQQYTGADKLGTGGGTYLGGLTNLAGGQSSLGAMQPGMAYAGGSATFNEAGNGQPPLINSLGPKSGGGYAGSNPYLGGMANEIGRRTQLGLDNAFNSIRSNAVGVGGLGGGRQGVAQGVATGQAMDSLQGNLSNLFGSDWTGQQNRDLSRYGMDQNFYTAQRGQDQTGAALGANLFMNGQNAEWDPMKNASSIYSPYSGMGTTTQGTQSGGGVMGGVGGAMAGGAFGRQMGWW